jgi:alkylation response protein AidB-like acyl-CoA dehydrogenase
MSNAALLGTQGKNKEEVESLEVAEESRETEWAERSFVADLFMGKLHLASIFPYPEQSEEDRRIGDAFLAKLEAYLKAHLDPEKVDETGQIPDEVMKGLAELGCFGMKIPKEYGGLGLSQVNYNRALALFCSWCSSTGAMLSAHQSIGVPQPLMLFGTEEQKRKYLPRFARGEVSAFALTEPEVGSDPARMSTTATPTPDGKHYLINGTKLWCTNGAIAEVLVVMAQTPPVIKNGREKKQITAFIVEKNMPGFEVVHRCRFMGLNGIQNALLRFKDVKVPKENIIWGEGKGLRLALITLNAGRLSLPAGAIGGARQCLRICREWGNERKQWGAPVGKHEAGASKISSMAAHLFAMEAITWMSGTFVDRKSHDIRIEAAMAKIFCSEQTHRIVENTIQLRGGRGYERSSSLRARGENPFPAERALRDSRINMIVEGTSEILRLFVAREALDRHLKIAGDVLNPRLGLGRRAGALLKAAAFYAGWYPWQWIAPLFGFWPRCAGMGRLGGHLRFAARASHRLARTIFHLMLRHGPKLERRQLQLFRVVDIAIDLFVISATVARARARLGEPSEYPNVEDVADLFCREARERVRENFRALRHNADSRRNSVAREILAGGGTWLEKEVVSP